MNEQQFEMFYSLAKRFVEAYEHDQRRRDHEWDEVQEELKQRRESIAKLKEMFGEDKIPDNPEIIDLNSLFDEVDDDENSSD